MARSSLRAIEADERRASDELAEAKARDERRQKNPDFFSKEDLAQAALQAKTAASGLEAARSRSAEQRARIAQLQTTLSRNEIRAPFDGAGGRALRRSGRDRGARHAAGAADQRRRPHGAGRRAPRGGPPARRGHAGHGAVRDLGLPVPGTIQRIAPEVDAASQMVLVEIRLEPAPGVAGRLQTGLVVDVRAGEPG